MALAWGGAALELCLSARDDFGGGGASISGEMKRAKGAGRICRYSAREKTCDLDGNAVSGAAIPGRAERGKIGAAA